MGNLLCILNYLNCISDTISFVGLWAPIPIPVTLKASYGRGILLLVSQFQRDNRFVDEARWWLHNGDRLEHELKYSKVRNISHCPIREFIWGISITIKITIGIRIIHTPSRQGDKRKICWLIFSPNYPYYQRLDHVWIRSVILSHLNQDMEEIDTPLHIVQHVLYLPLINISVCGYDYRSRSDMIRCLLY